MSYSSAITFPHEIDPDDVIQRNMALGRGQTLHIRAQSEKITRMTIVSGSMHDFWLNTSTVHFSLYNQIGTSFYTSITAPNYTILFIYWNNSLIQNMSEPNELIFDDYITGLDEDVFALIFFLLVIVLTIEVLHQCFRLFRQFRFEKHVPSSAIGLHSSKNLFPQEGKNRLRFIFRLLWYLFRREYSTFPSSILYGVCLLGFWIINPIKKVILIQPTSSLLSLTLIASWNSIYSNLWPLWTGMFLLIGLFFWKSRLETSELRDYLSLPVQRTYFLLIALILLITGSFVGLLFLYFVIVPITYLRFGVLPNFELFFLHQFFIFFWVALLFLCGSIGIFLFRGFPLYSVIVFLSLFLFSLLYGLSIFFPDLLLPFPANQTSFLDGYLTNPVGLINNVVFQFFIYSVLLFSLFCLCSIAINRLQIEATSPPKIFGMFSNKVTWIFREKKLSTRFFSIDFSKTKISAVTICFLVFFGLSIGQIFVSFFLVNREYHFKSGFRELWGPIEPGSEVEVEEYVVIAPGEIGIVNISTSLDTTLKLIEIPFGSDLNTSHFHGYMSTNSSLHFLKTSSVPTYKVYRLYLRNLNNQSIDFRGTIVVTGVNFLYFLTPAVLIAFFCGWVLFRSVFVFSRKPFVILPKGTTLTESSLSLISFVSRFRLLWGLQYHEFSKTRIAFTAALIWLIIQPLVTLTSFRSASVRYQDYYHLLNAAGDSLFIPIVLCLFILLLFLAIDTAEVIAGKHSRRDLLALYSLPIKRTEWILVTFCWSLLLYGGLLISAILLKVFLLNFQMKFFYPLFPLIFLILFLLLTLSAWIVTGIFFSIQSSSPISASIKSLVVVLIGTMISLVAVSDGDPHHPMECGGVLGLVNWSWIMWRISRYHPCVYLQENGLFVATLPHLEPLFISLIHTLIWVGVGGILIIFRLKRLEIN